MNSTTKRGVTISPNKNTKDKLLSKNARTKLLHEIEHNYTSYKIYSK